MKTIYVSDLLSENQMERNIVLSGWLASRRHIGKVMFLDISDSTGTIQAVVERGNIQDEIFKIALRVPLESGIEIKGKITKGDNGVVSCSGEELYGHIGEIKTSYWGTFTILYVGVKNFTGFVIRIPLLYDYYVA